MEKMTFKQLKEDYINNDVCMGEFLGSVPATGLTIKQAFFLYIRAMSWCEEDEFVTYKESEYVDLVEEARKMEL